MLGKCAIAPSNSPLLPLHAILVTRTLSQSFVLPSELVSLDPVEPLQQDMWYWAEGEADNDGQS